MGKRMPTKIEWIEIQPDGETTIRRGAPWCESGGIEGIKFNARYWVVAFDEPGQFQLIGEASKRLRKSWTKFYSRNEKLKAAIRSLAESPEGTLFYVSRNSRIGDVQSEYAFRKPWFIQD